MCECVCACATETQQQTERERQGSHFREKTAFFTQKKQTWDWGKVKKEENDAGVWGQRPQKLKVFSVCHHKKQHSGA